MKTLTVMFNKLIIDKKLNIKGMLQSQGQTGKVDISIEWENMQRN